MTLEQAKVIAEEKAKQYGKIIFSIYENDEYWFFEAGLEDGRITYDDGAGSVFISKKDGSVVEDNYYLSDFCQRFHSTAREIYNRENDK